MRTVIVWLVAFVFISLGNALTHGPLFGAAMNEATALIAPSTAQASTFVFLGLVWALLTSGTVYVALRERPPQLRSSVVAGALVGVLVDGSWNLINKSIWPQWSNTLIVVDIAWHAAHGALAGALVYWLWHRLARGSSLNRAA